MATDVTDDLIGSKEACALLGDVHRATLVRRVWSGALEPVAKLPGKNGAYLFRRADVEALRDAEAQQ